MYLSIGNDTLQVIGATTFQIILRRVDEHYPLVRCMPRKFHVPMLWMDGLIESNRDQNHQQLVISIVGYVVVFRFFQVCIQMFVQTYNSAARFTKRLQSLANFHSLCPVYSPYLPDHSRPLCVYSRYFPVFIAHR